MESKVSRTVNGIPRWACPWAASWSGIQDRSHARPKNAHRRIKTVGAAATGVAAAIWVMAIVWVAQVLM